MKNTISIFLLLMLSVSLSAQKARKARADKSAPIAETNISSAVENGIADTALVKAYADSLVAYRHRLDSVIAGNDSLRTLLLGKSSPSIVYQPITSPLTFNYGVAGRQFNVGTDDADVASAVDMARLRMYLAHPELVYDTEKKLRAAGTIQYKPQAPVYNDNELSSLVDTVKITESNDVVENISLVSERPNFWKFLGDYSLQFMQNYVSENWHKGGTSNLALLGTAVMQLNYNDKEKVKWDNKLEMKLGFQTATSDEVHRYLSSEDLLRLTSKLGVQATKHWYYTLQMIGSTQFTKGYKSNDAYVYSDFMSPFTLNLSLGMEYKLSAFKDRLTGSLNISPLSANLKYVDRPELAERNGIDADHRSKWELGSTFTGNLTWKISNFLKWDSRIYGLCTYHSMEMEWENTFTFQITKYISTKVFVYPRFDDSVSDRNEDYGYFQLKEYVTLGVNYSF